MGGLAWCATVVVAVVTLCTAVAGEPSTFTPREYGSSGFHAAILSQPAALVAGVPAVLKVQLQDYRLRPIPWSDLLVYHARKLHVVILGQSLDVMAHVHPEDFGDITADMSSLGQYPVHFTFPQPGRYALAVDFVVPGNNAEPPAGVNVTLMGPRKVFVSKYLNVTVRAPEQSAMKPMAPPAALAERLETSVVGVPQTGPDKFTKHVSFAKLGQEAASAAPSEKFTLKLHLGGGVHVGECARLELEVVDGQGKGISDLSPYLDAAFHVAIADRELSLASLQHVHAMIPAHVEHMSHMPPPGGWSTFSSYPMSMCDQYYAHMHHDVPTSFGPRSTIYAQFEVANTYVLFVQGKARNDELIFAKFSFEVHLHKATLTTVPSVPVAGVATQLTFSLKTGFGVSVILQEASEAELAHHGGHQHGEEHGKSPMLHAMVLSEDFSLVGVVCAFSPDGADGVFKAKFIFPKAGKYALSLVFTPRSSASSTVDAASHNAHPTDHMHSHKHGIAGMEHHHGHSMHEEHSMHGHGMEEMDAESQRLAAKLVEPSAFSRGVVVTVDVEPAAPGDLVMKLDPDKEPFDASKATLGEWPAVRPGSEDDDPNTTAPAHLDMDAESALGKVPPGNVQLKANNGQPVYAGECAPLRFMFTGVRGMPISDLAAYMGAGVRVLVTPKVAGATGDAVETWAVPVEMRAKMLKRAPTMAAARMVVQRSLQLKGHDEGLLDIVMDHHDLCDTHHRYHVPKEPNATFGPMVLAHVLFTRPGPHVVVVQAMRAGRLLVARFEVNVCRPDAELRWSGGSCTFARPVLKATNVLVPKGGHLVLDVSPPPLGSVVVEGVLQVDPDAKQIDLAVGRLVIRKGGQLLVGSPAKPFRGILNVTLLRNSTLGNNLANNPFMGDRLFSNRGGRVEMYGSMTTLPWGVLAKPAAPGDTALTLKTAPGWKAGDRVVVAGSGAGAEGGGAEEVTVAGCEKNLVRLTAPLVGPHSDEVALLSRGIVISSQPDPWGGGGRLIAAADDASEASLKDLTGGSQILADKMHRAAALKAGRRRRRARALLASRAAGTGVVGATLYGRRAWDPAAGFAATAGLAWGHDLGDGVDDFHPTPKPSVAGARRKLLHSNSGAYWAKRNLDAGLIMVGAGQTGLYEAQPKPMSLQLYGVELQGLGQTLSPQHSAVTVQAGAFGPGAGNSSVRLQKCVVAHARGRCVHVEGAPGALTLDNNVCFDAVDSGFAVLLDRPTGLLDSKTPAPLTPNLHHNLAMAVAHNTKNVAAAAQTPAAGFRLGALLPATTAAGAASGAGAAGAGRGLMRLQGNGAAEVDGHGYIVAPSVQLTASSGGNLAHHNSGVGVLAGQGASECYDGRTPPAASAAAAAPGTAAAATLNLFTAKENRADQKRDASHDEAALPSVGEPFVTRLLPNTAPTELLQIPALEDGYTEAATYFAFTVPREAATVYIYVQSKEVSPGNLKVLLNPWGGLPCTNTIPHCQPNPAKVNKKYFSYALQIKSNVWLPWRHPSYSVGTWYLGMVGTPGDTFSISVNVTLCNPGEMGYIDDQAKFTYLCTKVPQMAINERLSGFLYPSHPALHFAVDVPPFASQMYVTINRTAHTGEGTLYVSVRPAALPTINGFNGAAYHVPGQDFTSGAYTNVMPVPPAGKYFITVAGLPKMPPNRARGRPAMVPLSGDTTVNFTVMAGVDTCGPDLMGNPYFFPPHHDEDFIAAARNRPAPIQCDLYAPLVVGRHERRAGERRGRVVMGERSTLDSEYFYFNVPVGTHRAVVFLNMSETGRPPRGDLMINWGNFPVQLDLEDYYMWQFDYKQTFQGRAGVLARLELHPGDLYGKWGNWFIGIDWMSRGSDSAAYTVRVEYENAEGSRVSPPVYRAEDAACN